MALAKEGASATIFARTREPLAEAAREIGAATGQAVHFVPANATSSDDCKRVVSETVDRFDRLDILVNNAGRHRRILGGNTDWSGVLFESWGSPRSPLDLCT